MTKTIQTVVKSVKFYDEVLERDVHEEYHYEIIEETGENYGRRVSVNLLKVIEDGVEEQNIPLYRKRAFEEFAAEEIAKQRGIVTKQADEYGFDGI